MCGEGSIPGFSADDQLALAVQAEHDESRMRQALALAQRAAAAGEVPVGAVLELRGQVVATAHNQSDTTVRRRERGCQHFAAAPQ